jgi:hypothetical protein
MRLMQLMQLMRLAATVSLLPLAACAEPSAPSSGPSPPSPLAPPRGPAAERPAAERRRSDPAPEVLLERARLGGDYLTRVVLPEGRFVYSYSPETDSEEGGYNMVRHAGTVYAMLDLWRTTRGPELLAAAERALDYLLECIVPFGREDDGLRAVAFDGTLKLGSAALAALALAEHCRATGARTHLPAAQGLCRYLRASQRPSGEFLHQREYPSGKPRDFVSDYYSGEALFALTRVYSLDRDPGWLDAAESGARYLIETRDGARPEAEILHDHWLLYALNELHRERPLPLYAEHALRIARAILPQQNRAPLEPAHLGSHYDPPRSTPTATRTEGLLAAHELALRAGRSEEARAILEAAALGARFQLETQVVPERGLRVRNPGRALGGFTRSLADLEIRIDYVQHNVSALIALHRALLAAGERE